MTRQFYAYGFSLTCVMTMLDGGGGRDRENGGHYNPPRSPGTPFVGLTKKAWDQTLTHLRLPGLKLGDDSRNTQLLHLIVKEVLCP